MDQKVTPKDWAVLAAIGVALLLALSYFGVIGGDDDPKLTPQQIQIINQECAKGPPTNGDPDAVEAWVTFCR